MTDEIIPWLERFGGERPSEVEERAELLKLAQECTCAIDEYNALKAAGKSDAEADRKSRWERARHLFNIARDSAIRGFAVDRCLLIGAPFTIVQLRGRPLLRDSLPFVRRIMHREVTYLRNLNGAPAALLSSCLPSERSRCDSIARREGLVVEELPFSFYSPGRDIGLLYQKAPQKCRATANATP